MTATDIGESLSGVCDPRSLWEITPLTSPPRVLTAISIASVTNSVRMWSAMDQPATRREQMSITVAKYIQEELPTGMFVGVPA